MELHLGTDRIRATTEQPRNYTWERIESVIERQILPRVDAEGAAVFAPVRIERRQEPLATCGGVPTSFRRLPHPQLVYVVTGADVTVVGDRWFSVPAGHGLFIAAEQPHAVHAAVQGRAPACTCLWFDVLPFGVIVHRCEATPAAHRSGCRYVLLDSRLADLLHEGVAPGGHRLEMGLASKGLLLAFFGLLLRAPQVPMTAESPSPPGPDRGEDLPPVLRRAVEIVHVTYHRPFDLRALAAACFVSPFHLCRLFRRHLDTTPLAYLTAVRLEHARRLLEATELPVGDVAKLVGYPTNQAHFTRLFQRTYGIAPSAARRSPGRRGRLLKERPSPRC